jgi:hypothetical protein
MSCRHLGQRRAEIGYDPETATVRLSPTWGTTPQPLGFAPEPMLGLDFLPAQSRLVQDGMGPRSGQGVRSPPPLDAPPTRARQGQRVKTTTRGRESRVRDRTDRSQKPEAVVSKT